MVSIVLDSVIEKSHILITQLHKWKSKVDFKFQVGPYVLRLAQSKKDVIACFRLRHEIFCREMAGRETRTGLDFDEYDLFCDHLMIENEDTGEIVGTYRLNFSKTAKKFYTNSEFHIHSWIENQSQPFLELGRACIHKDHRRGVVITLLWKGIAEYMRQVGAEQLIGCSSVKVTDARSAALIFKYLELQGALSSEVFSVRSKYEMSDFIFWLMIFAQGLTQVQITEAEEKIPALLKSYIKAGAKVCSYPALDLDFNCIDFVTILKKDNLNTKLARKLGA